MTRETLLSMEDAALVTTVGDELEKKFDLENELTGAEIVAYTLWIFDAEVKNGGLRQFFCNEFSEVAPLVPSSLLNVDAVEYEALLAHFLDETAVDLDDPWTAADARLYPAYTEFDDAFHALYQKQPLVHTVAEYIRQHADLFID